MPNATKISRQREFMRTTITISVVRHSEFSTVEILDAIESAFGEFDRIVKQYTRFDQHSELSNLNRNQGKWVKISQEFAYLIGQMLNLAEQSNGAFDPTIIDFLEVYGYDPNYDFSKLDNPDLDSMIKKLAETRPSWKEIEIDIPQHRAKLALNQRLDLGGLGKGYAIDCAYDKLDKFPDFLIDAGGDTRAKGRNENGEIWQIGLKHLSAVTGEESIIGIYTLDNQSLACSGSWARRVKQFHHILDPQTGLPVETAQTVFVVAPTATMSDGWATTLFVGGKELLEKLPVEAEAAMITSDDRIINRGGIFDTPI